MDFLDKLLEDQKSLKRINDAGNVPLKAKEIRVPDALVLITRIFTCEGCGEVYEIPNHRVLFRFGINLVKIKFWIDRFNSILIREIKVYHEKVPSCGKCINERFFTYEDFDLNEKK